MPDTPKVKVPRLLPNATPEMVLLANLALAILPANMVLVTVPVSVVYTPLVTVLALPDNVAVIVPALKLPEASLATTLDAVFAEVASTANVRAAPSEPPLPPVM